MSKLWGMEVSYEVLCATQVLVIMVTAGGKEKRGGREFEREEAVRERWMGGK